MTEYLMLAGAAGLVGWEAWSRYGDRMPFLKPQPKDASKARLKAIESLEEVLDVCQEYGWDEAGKHCREAARALYDGEWSKQ